MAHGHMAVVEESGARLREVGLDIPRLEQRNGSGSLAKSATDGVNVVWPQLSPNRRALEHSTVVMQRHFVKQFCGSPAMGRRRGGEP